MSAIPDLRGPPPAPPPPLPLRAVLGDEGFRIFFPLAALFAALWPLWWVWIWAFDLPSGQVPPAVWHAHEMIFGAWGAALIGFLTTAAPEWTDTPRLQHRPLWRLAGVWAIARLPGLTGWDALAPVILADLVWLAGLAAYLARISWQRRSDRLLAFLAWLLALGLAAGAAKAAMLTAHPEPAAQALRVSGFLYLGLLGLALARITVPVTNLVLDPTEATSPFRPHPGRLNLAPGLVALAVAGEGLGLSPAVLGFLWIAAGAAFLDRVAEAFIGPEALRAEVLALAGSAALAGAGLLAFGAARLGAPWAEAAPLHLAFMGGLGLGVLAVLCIAGRLHCGRPLGLPGRSRAGLGLVVLASLLRALPEMGLMPWPPGPAHGLAALAWAAGFGLWLADAWPDLRDPRTLGARRC
ncbi:MAG: NnrS family protein [Tabrizicola flagellatus]|uniref:NnrS family protein n=1 Tax=Tabrizicola flagellatus TaxID=2593021 RepID=UPI00391DA887